MKRCPKCGEKYADYMQNCPSCNISLEIYEEVQISEQLHKIYQKIIDLPIIKKFNDFLHNCISKIKVYHIAIICIILVSVVFGSYICGTFKQYTNTSVSTTFKKNEDKFEELTALTKDYETHKKEKDALDTKISAIKKQLDTIKDFENKQNDYTSEIQNLTTQINNLTSQKTQKEKTLNDIEYELSQY